MNKSEEIKYLSWGGFEETSEVLLETIAVFCDGNASIVLEKTKDVLKKVIDCELSYDDSVEDWHEVLPKWFVDSCSPEFTQQQIKYLLANPDECDKFDDKWTISNFLNWFKPNERSWYWADAKNKG